MVEQPICLIVMHFLVSLIVKSVARLGLHVSETMNSERKLVF